MRLNHGYAELQCLLVFDTRSSGDTSRSLRTIRSCSWRGTNKVRRINLDLVTPFRLHFLQRLFGIFQEGWVLHISETNGNARGVGNGMCTDVEEVG